MGNEQQKKGKMPAPKPPSAAEIKTYIMIIQNKIALYRNKKVSSIKQKQKEIEKCLRENNLDVAKAKMDSIIREEDMITVYDILTPLCEILKERVTYIISSTECPPDLRAQLDSVLYASTRVEISEFQVLRDLILRKYGQNYIAKADANVDKLVNVNLEEKLRVKSASDVLLVIRLKQLCKEKKIQFEFPAEVLDTDFNVNPGNPYGGQPNPFDMPGQNNFNPYSSNIGPQNMNNNFNNFNNNNNNPYGPPQNNNFNNNNNPYGPPQNNNINSNNNSNFNPYGSNMNNNNNNNPFNNSQMNNNPFSQPPQNNNPFNQPPQSSQFNQPPQSSQFNQPPQNSQFSQPPQSSQFGKPPQSSQFNQPPQSSQFGKPPQSSQFNQPPQSSQFNQPPQSSQFNQPPQNSQFGKPPQNSQFSQPPQNSQFSQPPQNSQINQPPQFSQMGNSSQNNSPFDQPPQNSQFGKPPSNDNNNDYPFGKTLLNNTILSSKNNNDNPYGPSNSQLGKSNNNINNSHINPFGSGTQTQPNNYSIDENKSNQNPFETPVGQSINNNLPKSSLRAKPNQNPEASQNPYLNESSNKNNNSQSNLFYEATVVEENKNNDNPYGNNNVEMNNPFGEGFNKSIAESVTNPYADNVNNNNNNNEVKKSQNNVQNSMQGSIVDDVKFKESIPEFKDNDEANNDFPKSE